MVNRWVSRAQQSLAAYRTAKFLYPLAASGYYHFRNQGRTTPVSKFTGYNYSGYVRPQNRGRDMTGYTGSRMPVQLARKPRTTALSRKAPLAARVKRLEKQSRDEVSILTYKVNAKDSIRPPAMQTAYGFASCLSISNIETAAANARFFDPSAPTTPVVASLVAGAFQSKFRVAATCQITFKNNFQVPCVLIVAQVRPRVATSTGPTQVFRDGLTDQGNPDSNSVMLTWSDSKQFKETYRFSVKPKRYVLPAGKEVTLRHRQRSFLYDPSFFDSNAATYQPKARSTLWVYRVCGEVGHDTAVATEIGLMPAGIDVFARDTYTIQYNSGGAPFDTIVVSDGATTTFTNGPVCSQVVRDNQAYSVS